MKKLRQLATVAFACLAAATTAQAATGYRFGYNFVPNQGFVISGTMVGTLQGDNNTILLSGFNSIAILGTPVPVPPLLVNPKLLLTNNNAPLGTSLDGNFQNFCLGTRTTCGGSGFMFATDFFAPGGHLFLSSAGYAGAHEPYDPSLWSISGVPEPSEWAMLIAGFGLVGAAMRRRRPIAA